MTAKRLTPAMMRAMEPYLRELLAVWERKRRIGRAWNLTGCCICKGARHYRVGNILPWLTWDCQTCPVFGKVARIPRDEACNKFFPEVALYANADTAAERRPLAAATVKRLEAVRDWLQAQREKGATGDG